MMESNMIQNVVLNGQLLSRFIIRAQSIVQICYTYIPITKRMYVNTYVKKNIEINYFIQKKNEKLVYYGLL